MSFSVRPIEQTILVAVDFGTTFSSVAWEQTGEAGVQNIIQLWPDEDSTDQDFHGKTTDKVPTTLTHDRGVTKWGYQIEDREKRYEWFKLDLDPSLREKKYKLRTKCPGTRQLPTSPSPNSPASAQRLTTSYLEALRSHVNHMLERSILRAVLKNTRLEYIITVPAIWSEKARDLTLKCASDAGMGSKDQLQMVSEPEAAAMYSISKFRQINSSALEVGDTFVLCDAGGGTVDLISYTIKALDPILDLVEAASGDGDACGSTFLNRRFAKLLNDRFKDDHNWRSDPEILDLAMEHFEKETKIRFNGKKGDTIPVAGVESGPGINRHRLALSNKEIKRIFDPVISEVLSLIRRQIERTTQQVKFILLVGGFGNSIYLRSRIQEEVGMSIEVKVSPDWKRNSFTGEFHVDVMKWFLEKDQSMEEIKPVSFPFSTDFPVSGDRPQKIDIDIFCHFDPRNMGAPQYKTLDVEKLATVSADVHDLDPGLLKEQLGGDGNDYYVMDFDIEMSCIAGKLEFTPIYIHENRKHRFPPAIVDYE